jgi:acyl-CoA hydrolase
VERLGPQEAAARLGSRDELGLPLGPGQPPSFLRALGERDDWEDLRCAGALLAVGTGLFAHPGVHLLSGFFGPFERALRDQDANISFAPADFRRFGPLLQAAAPRVMATAAAPPDADGWCSLSLHAGGTVAELRRAGADPSRLLVVEVHDGFPRTNGLLPDFRHALHVDEIDLLVEGDTPPLALPAMEPTEVDEQIAAHARRFIEDGTTLQTGIGGIPNAVARRLAEGEGGGYGIHTEMLTDGLMALHRAGKVANRKGQFDGRSVVTFAMGSQELYAWLQDNEEIAFLPVEVVNAPEVIVRNRRMVTINGALSIDVHGQVVADTILGRQHSGIGGAEDFGGAPGLTLEARSLTCLPSTYTTKDGERRSRIVPVLPEGAVVTTPRHQVDVVITEFGVAALEGRTVHGRGDALAAIAHPDFRDELHEAAARASKGRSPRHPG